MYGTLNPMTITIEIKSAYGVKRFYPVCDKAKAFASLADTRTLARHHLLIIENLGFKVVTQQPEQDWRE